MLLSSWLNCIDRNKEIPFISHAYQLSTNSFLQVLLQPGWNKRKWDLLVGSEKCYFIWCIQRRRIKRSCSNLNADSIYFYKMLFQIYFWINLVTFTSCQNLKWEHNRKNICLFILLLSQNAKLNSELYTKKLTTIVLSFLRWSCQLFKK